MPSVAAGAPPRHEGEQRRQPEISWRDGHQIVAKSAAGLPHAFVSPWLRPAYLADSSLLLGFRPKRANCILRWPEARAFGNVLSDQRLGLRATSFLVTVASTNCT